VPLSLAGKLKLVLLFTNDLDTVRGSVYVVKSCRNNTAERFFSLIFQLANKVERFHLLSLRWRLLLLVALAIAPLIAMTIAVGVREREHALSSAQENLQRITNLAAANEAQSIEQAMQILRDLSSVHTLLENKEKCDEVLADILRKNGDYVNFGVIAPNGDVTCSAVPTANIVNLRDRDHFKRAVAERRFIAGNYVFGRVVHKHTVNLTYPIIKNGEVVAVLFAALHLTELDKFVSDIRLPADSILWTLDEQGGVISRRPAAADWFGKKPPGALHLIAGTKQHPMVHLDSDKVERLYASAGVGPKSLSGYTVLIGVPEAGVLANARRDQRFALVGLLATVLLAGMAAWWGGDILIVRRVRRLANTANSIASGALSTRTGVRYGNEEISDLARALDDMAQSLEMKQCERDKAEASLVAADKRKDEFLAMLAHELRNPLAPISAGAQILLQTQKDNAIVARTATVIARQVSHMTSLVNDLLDVSRVTTGIVKLENTVADFRTIVSDAVEQVGPLINQKRQKLTLRLPDESCFVAGDMKRLVQITANLMNNAAKYTDDGGTIKVTLARLADRVKVSVSDNGIGMAPSLVPRVFDLFTQAERTSDRAQGGLGIGLALVKTLVQLHGGSVAAESPGPGLGSTFAVELPLAASPSRHEVSATNHALPIRPKRCLVVDDNVDAGQTLAMLLAAAGHQVSVAYSATEGLELALKKSPEVFLLDVGLPDFDGNELVGMIRRQPEFASALTIAVTGYGRSVDRERALAAGFDHYLVKPVDIKELEEAMANPRAPTLRDAH
jgi:signal transduction histidine kinase/ActR/RegA family two-component response regulator